MTFTQWLECVQREVAAEVDVAVWRRHYEAGMSPVEAVRQSAATGAGVKAQAVHPPYGGLSVP